MLRSRVRASGLALAQSLQPSTICKSAASCVVAASRPYHSVPQLKTFDPSKGIPGLLSTGGFRLAWSEYMRLVIDKLNALTAGSEFEDMDTKTVALMTAREPSQAPIFNYASMAHNNHFFFNSIAPAPVKMPEALRKELELSFSSIETLRREFLLTASAMFGPGFIWLVKSGPGSYRIVTTYLAGSPYAGAHWRLQPSDMNSIGDGGTAKPYMNRSNSSNAQDVGNLPPGGIDAQPLLCLNTWQHVWLADWGLGGASNSGKDGFADAWWKLVNWEFVWSRAGGRSQLAFRGGGETERTSAAEAEKTRASAAETPDNAMSSPMNNGAQDMRDYMEPETTEFTGPETRDDGRR